jgi:hypothetical protein
MEKKPHSRFASTMLYGLLENLAFDRGKISEKQYDELDLFQFVCKF